MSMFGYEERGPFHDTAQVCLNGHVINDSFHTSPEFNQKFCDQCGEPAITACPSCGSEIRGDYKVPGVAVVGNFAPAASYCANCGHSYPWTERRLQAAKDLADEFDELDDAQRAKLKDSLDDLTKDSPQTEVAATRFKKLVAKLSIESAGALRSIVTDVLSETAKKILLQ